MLHQKTIATPITCRGVGVHSGKKVTMQLLPAEISSGIRFIRTDLDNEEIEARYPNVTSIGYSTTIVNKNKACVNTVEHLMSALWSLNITNIAIRIDAEEVPIMDGSAEYFIFVLESAGIALQDRPIETLSILQDVTVEDGDKKITARPYKDGLFVEFHPDFGSEYKLLPMKSFSFDSTKSSFKYDFARARTFSTVEQVMFLRSKGMAVGGSKLNALVINKDGMENDDPLRYYNEPTRHKVLDCIGDFYLSGYHIHGHFECYKSGHQMNLKMLEKIFEDNKNYAIITQH